MNVCFASGLTESSLPKRVPASGCGSHVPGYTHRYWSICPIHKVQHLSAQLPYRAGSTFSPSFIFSNEEDREAMDFM